MIIKCIICGEIEIEVLRKYNNTFACLTCTRRHQKNFGGWSYDSWHRGFINYLKEYYNDS